MKIKKSLFITLFFAVIALFIHIYSNDSARVENQYATGIYPAFSRMLRFGFGWLPFSIGDVVYGLIVLWLTWKTVYVCKVVLKRRVNWQRFRAAGLKTLGFSLAIYIIFNLFWGINYNRIGIANQLHLKIEKYGQDDLKKIDSLLVEKVNASKLLLVKLNTAYPTNRQLFVKVQQAYKAAEEKYPFLKYDPVSIKPSVWSWMGNYLGFTGYYNPFTGEAQVNTLVPKFLQPFTSCHEVAHQLGYARENEANFVAYLAATASPDTLLHYSLYLDLYMYSNRNLYAIDSAAANTHLQQLSQPVKDDLKEWRIFNKNHRNPVEPVFRWIYGKYLEGNQQPQGVLSYDEVTGFIIAYYKKYGKI
jgi:hypothetical protein